LEECIAFSDGLIPLLPHQQGCSVGIGSQDDVSEADGGGGWYTHRRPIRVTPRSLLEGHNMGATLSLIITFNIALAHHLGALSEDTPNRRGRLRKILHLYELAYKWQTELERSNSSCDDPRTNVVGHPCHHHHHHRAAPESSAVASLRFNMIVCNNLGQVHRLVDDRSRSYLRCLEHLLSTVMFVVDTEGTDDNGGGRSRRRMDLEGFLRNATTLILQEQCAGAA
jgi:hypothetical protein